jgi:2-keto-3-deoxy-L-rhamnonate aldolase RhmA
MRAAQIREKLHLGQCVYGTHIASLGNPVAAAIAAQMELDFAFFCTEHMPLDRTEVSLLCQLYASRGISPIVRVPTADAAAISMALDGGAQGIVVPYVETVEEVRRAVGAVRYRPIKGKLLREVLAGKAELPSKTRRFLDEFNKENYLIIGIESVAAIEHLEQLIGIEGVDGVFLGPHDITVSMGIPEEYRNPVFIETIEDIVRRCRRCSVGVGLHYPLLKFGQETVRRWMEAGMNWIINGADITLMRDTMNAQLQQLRQIAGDIVRQPRDSTDSARPQVKVCIS